jgi:hypothetical protein
MTRSLWIDLLWILKRHDDEGGQASNETIVLYDYATARWLVGERGRKARPVDEETAKWWLSE